MMRFSLFEVFNTEICEFEFFFILFSLLLEYPKCLPYYFWSVGKPKGLAKDEWFCFCSGCT